MIRSTPPDRNPAPAGGDGSSAVADAPASDPAAGGAKDPLPLLQGPKRQHFLPRFHLEGFARQGLVAVYDREKSEIRLQQPVNTGVIGHFYTMEDEQGRKRFEIEQLLSEYEGKAKPVVERLAAGEEVDDDQRTDLAIFIALGAMRTPDIVESLQQMNSGLVERVMRTMYGSVEQVLQDLRRDEANTGKTNAELEIEARIMVDIAHQVGVVKTSSKWAISMAMKMALEIAPTLAGRDWRILHRDHAAKSFVTTDAPVVLTTIAPRPTSFWGGVGYGNADALVIFPLTESCVLTMFGNSGRFQHRQADRDRIRQINLAVASRCKRFVVGRDEKLVESLATQLRLSETPWKPKMRMG